MDDFLHKASVNDIINYYNIIVKFVDSNAQQQIDRAYGGFIRETEGHLQEINNRANNIFSMGEDRR